MGQQEKGKQVVYIDAWYPSSKRSCGHLLKELDRPGRCAAKSAENTGTNASINIKVLVSTWD